MTLRHLAIIPDGNRRWAARAWATARGGPSPGFPWRRAPRLIEAAWVSGIHTVTLWLFSTDNWRRSREEVDRLMAIYEQFVGLAAPLASRYAGRLHHLGRRDRIPPSLAAAITNAEEATARARGARAELGDWTIGGPATNCCASLAGSSTSCPAGGLSDEPALEPYFDLTDQPHPAPDLIIRTSGEQRLSGFMPWHSAYSELAFVEKCYPRPSSGPI